MKGSTIGLIVVSVLVLLIGGAFAFMFGSTEGGSGRSSASTLSNIKQFSLGLLMYTTDYDDRLPVYMADVRNLKSVIDPYIPNYSVYETYNPNGGTIEPNKNLAGALHLEIEDTDKTVMLFETEDWPNGGRNVGFSDGHAKYQTGFDREKDLVVGLTPVGVKDMEEQAAALEAQAAAASGPPPTSALGMPGG